MKSTQQEQYIQDVNTLTQPRQYYTEKNFLCDFIIYMKVMLLSKESITSKSQIFLVNNCIKSTDKAQV